jgi:hypothetical protein
MAAAADGMSAPQVASNHALSWWPTASRTIAISFAISR